jgi:hypothetical protein
MRQTSSDLAMDLDEFRFNLEGFRASAERDAAALKDSQQVLLDLRNLYQTFDANERSLADRVIAEWLASDDESLRFDALSLVADFALANTTGALNELAGRLRESTLPGAPFELLKVERLLRAFASGAE